MPQKCILFGHKGYLGRHLAAELEKNGDEVILSLGNDGNRLDLAEKANLGKIDWDVDIVYFFAGTTGTKESFISPKESLINNNLALLNVLDSIQQSKFRPRVIFPSTRLIYKGSDLPLSENSMQSAKTIYAANKIACEHYLQAYSAAFDIPWTALRISIPYGNSFGSQYSFGTLGNFFRQAKNSGRISIYGSGTGKRTFTHVVDICRFTVLAAGHPKTINRAYNIPGEELSLFDAAALVSKFMKVAIEKQDWPDLDQRIETGSTVLDGAPLLQILQTSPIYKFAEWLKSADYA